MTGFRQILHDWLWGMPVDNTVTPSSSVSQPLISSTFGGAYNTDARTRRSHASSTFQAVNALTQNAFSDREIYPVDVNGNRFVSGSEPVVWQLLQHPNTSMSFDAFLQSAFRSYLQSPTTDILCWQNTPYGNQPGFSGVQNISGLTFLPRSSRHLQQGCWRFTPTDISGAPLSDVGTESVMTLSYMTDVSTMTPMSPCSASADVSQILEQLTLQIQAYFRNNAVPAVAVSIRARSQEEFDALKRQYEQSVRGATHYGGAVYLFAGQNDPLHDDNAVPAIDIKPIGADVNQLQIQAISDFAHQTINSNLGVSALMFGDTSATSYQNQETVEAMFEKVTDQYLDSFLDALCSELNRVVGGIGFVFGYSVKALENTGRNQVVAQTRVSNVQAFTGLINLGVPSDKAATALNLASFIGLGASKAELAPATQINMTTEAKPVANKLTGSLLAVSKRKAASQQKVVDILKKMAVRKIRQQKTNMLDTTDSMYLTQLLSQLTSIADDGGVLAAHQLAQQIQGYTVGDSYDVSPDLYAQLSQRASDVIDSYSNYLDNTIDDDTTEDDVNDLSTGIGARIALIALASTKYATQSGQLDNASSIQTDMAAQGNVQTITKVWRAIGSAPCVFCSAINGTEAGIEDSFVPSGQIMGTNGDVLNLNPTYDDGTTPDAHPNCECVFTWSVSGDDEDNDDDDDS